MTSLKNIAILLVFICVTIQCLAKVNDYLEDSADDFSNLSANDEELETKRRKAVNAQDSWFTFVRHSKRLQNNSKNPRKRKDKKSKRLACAHGCVPGPVGPRGPPGPPGPSGARMTKEMLMEEFKELVREAAERRAYELVAEKCPNCLENSNSTSSFPLPSTNDVFDSVARVTVGFNMRLRRNIAISGRTFMELAAFHQPFAAGAFNRGENFNIKNGRFGAPKSGIYQFSVNLHMRIKRNGRRLKLRKRDNIRAQICIDSLCQKYASMQHISGLESNSKIFTISFMGFLELSAGQYASVYVDNASKVNIIVQTTSDFSGILVGL